MKRYCANLRLTIPIALAGALVFAFAGLSSKSTSASFSLRRSTGTVVIAKGQTARLNVVNTGQTGTTIVIALVEETERIVVESKKTLAAGQAVMLEFSKDSLIREENRIQLYGLIKFVDTVDTRIADKIIPTLEILDNETGKTIFRLPAIQKVRIAGS